MNKTQARLLSIYVARARHRWLRVTGKMRTATRDACRAYSKALVRRALAGNPPRFEPMMAGERFREFD